LGMEAGGCSEMHAELLQWVLCARPYIPGAEGTVGTSMIAVVGVVWLLQRWRCKDGRRRCQSERLLPTRAPRGESASYLRAKSLILVTAAPSIAHPIAPHPLNPSTGHHHPSRLTPLIHPPAPIETFEANEILKHYTYFSQATHKHGMVRVA
jgi:hypothetical protein